MLSFIEISKENLIHNVNVFRKYISPNAKIAAVIKGNAYGHGQNQVACILENYCDYFQIDDFQELELLRKISKKPILVLGYLAKEELEAAIGLDCIFGIWDIERLEIIDSIAKKLGKTQKVHLKIDAHLGRLGILPKELAEFIKVFKKFENISLEAVYSHFSNIEDTEDLSHSRLQMDSLDKARIFLRENGFSEIKKHISSSSGTMVYESVESGDIVRIGIGLYGMWPSESLRKKYSSNDFELRPVLRWVSHIAQVKTLPAGHPIGYGLSHITKSETKIAVIPQGYSDGYDRGFSNDGQILIRGTRCPVLGRIAMNMFVAEVSHLPEVFQEDEVILIGKQVNERISAEEMAEKLGTINYEITTRITPLLNRVVR